MISLFLLILNLPFHQNVPGIIHVQSDVSSGIYSIEKIAELARKRGIRVVIFTDKFLERFEYGIPPFRNIIKRTIRKRSITEYGIERYINEIKRVDNLFPDMLLIPGAEVRPSYYWTGNPLRNLTLHNTQKEFLVIGLSVEALKNLPVIGNRRLWYNQYDGDVGYKPFQDVIDYTLNNNGLIFWSLPEAHQDVRIGRVRVYRPPHPESLMKTDSYTGFGIIYEGMRTIGVPGGIWDDILREYIDGKRKSPIWAIGEIDYHYEGKSGKRIEDVQTVFLLESFDISSVITALRDGRMYARRRTEDFYLSLDEFSISGALMGGEVTLSDEPVLRIRLSSSSVDSQKVVIKVIRSGEPIKNLETTLPADIQFRDVYYRPGEMVYYRLEIRGAWPSIILTNPIFVRFK